MKQNSCRWRVVIVILAILAGGCGPSGSASPSSSATIGPTPSPKVYATPPARIFATMAYDVGTHEAVMYGGYNQTGWLNDTWAWDGKGWTQRNPHTVPTIQNPSMTYDAANSELLLVGSEVNGQQRPNSLWGWKDGNSGWVQRTVWMTPTCGKSCPPSTDLPFAAGGLTDDSAHNRVLMLTGAPAAPGDETWRWDGSKWNRIVTSQRPTLRSCCVSPDGSTGRLLALGYYVNWGGINRIWVFDGNDWTLSPISTPSGDAVMTDDPSTGRPLLVRSNSANNFAPGESWSWTGTSWQRLDVISPPMLAGSSVGYDAAGRQVVLFGGRDEYGNAISDTWVWNGRAWNKQP
jgi:hypothetical protein